MFRRTFFKSISAAILGTAIALKLPDSLVSKSPELLMSNSPYYEFGWTGYDGKMIHGRILAEINLELVTPRMSRTIYIENC